MKQFSVNSRSPASSARTGLYRLLFVVLMLLASAAMGGLLASGKLPWEAVPLLVTSPFLIGQPDLALGYILTEAWLTKEFPLVGVSLGHPLLTPAFILTGLLAVYIGGQAIQRREQVRIPSNTLNTVMLLFFGLICVSGYLGWKSINPAWLSNLVFYFLVLIFTNSLRRVKILIWTGIACSMIMAVGGVLQMLLLGGIPHEGITGALSNHVQYAWICWMGIPLAVAQWKNTRVLWQRVCLLAVVGFLTFAVVVSLTRSVTVIMLVSLPLLFSRTRDPRLVFVLVGLIVISAVLVPLIWTRLSTVQGLWSSDINVVNQTLSGRLMLYGAALRMIQKNPILGVGYQRFRHEWTQYAQGGFASDSSVLGTPLSAHSTFLQIGAETGVMGLVLYILILVLVWRNLNTAQGALRLSHSWLADVAWGLQIILLGFVPYGLFDNGGWNERYFYLVLALSVVLRNWRCDQPSGSTPA